jgi:hypothetical protein
VCACPLLKPASVYHDFALLHLYFYNNGVSTDT